MSTATLGNYCRICGQTASVYVCYPCLTRWKQAVVDGGRLLPLLDDELARQTSKAPTGTGVGDGAVEAVNLEALEVKAALQRALGRFAAQVGAAGVVRAYAHAQRLQEHPTDEPGLWGDYQALTDSIARARDLVDAREAHLQQGACPSCGQPVTGPSTSKRLTCPACGKTHPVAVLASHRRAQTLARVGERELTRQEVTLYIATALPGVKPATARKWVSRYLKPPYTSNQVADMVRARVETAQGNTK